MDLTVFRTLAEALAIGLLVGIERYKGRAPGEEGAAGVRTFAIFALLGAVCGLLDRTPFTLATFAALAALVLLSYFRTSEESLGLTTEFAALLVFWIGYLLHTHEVPAIALGIVLTIFLASKEALHHFVREQISESEFYATLKFLAVVLVVYPILPDRAMGPYGFLNPRQIWGLIILVSTISYAGYFLVRYLGARRGIQITGLAGGLVSTTAVTMSLAARSRQTPQATPACSAAAVLANSVQGPRLLILIWVVSGALGNYLSTTLIGMGLVGLVCGWFLYRRGVGEKRVEIEIRNPYSLTPVLQFGIFFVAVLFVIRVASQWLGAEGILLASGLAGLGSVSAVALTVAEMVSSQGLSFTVAGLAILVALTTNALTKWLIALLQGSRGLSLRLAAGLVVMLATAAALLYLSAAELG